MSGGSREEDDERILQLLKADDPAASTALYNNHFRAVLNYVRRFIYDKDQAKDIVQELFTVIWEKRALLAITRPIRKYLLSAAYNRLVNYKREQTRMFNLLQSISVERGKPDGPHTPDLEYEGLELNEIVQQAIDAMPTVIATTYVLSRQMNMTYKEIAAHLNVTEKAVEKNMHKALEILRFTLADYIKKPTHRKNEK